MITLRSDHWKVLWGYENGSSMPFFKECMKRNKHRSRFNATHFQTFLFIDTIAVAIYLNNKIK